MTETTRSFVARSIIKRKRAFFFKPGSESLAKPVEDSELMLVVFALREKLTWFEGSTVFTFVPQGNLNFPLWCSRISDHLR